MTTLTQIKRTAIAGLCSAPLLLCADPAVNRNTAAQINLTQGTRTAQLLELQRSGRVASPQQQQLPGKAQHNIYERYLKSFTHPIPETYISRDFTE